MARRTELPLRQSVLDPSALTRVLDAPPVILAEPVVVVVAVFAVVEGWLGAPVNSLALACARHGVR